MTDKRVDEINANLNGHVNGRCVLAPISDDPVTRWARVFAQNIREYAPDLEEKIIEWAAEDYMPMAKFQAKVQSHPDWEILFFMVFETSEQRLELSPAEFRFMFAAIPNEIEMLKKWQHIIDAIPQHKPTARERLTHRIDYLGYLVLSKVVIPPFTWALGKVKAYNERKGNK